MLLRYLDIFVLNFIRGKTVPGSVFYKHLINSINNSISRITTTAINKDDFSNVEMQYQAGLNMNASGPRHRQTQRHDGFSTHETHAGGLRSRPRRSVPNKLRMPKNPNKPGLPSPIRETAV
ncbi:hypothetical protein MTO96_036454 [Rhipicephalus appendiculatus]